MSEFTLNTSNAEVKNEWNWTSTATDVLMACTQTTLFYFADSKNI